MAGGGEPIAAVNPGLYVHVPFCPRRCRYCDFNAYVYREERAAGFITALETEAALAARLYDMEGCAFASWYLGGGTPTVLSRQELAAVTRALRKCFRLAPGGEFTVEANPETLDGDKLAALAAEGCNRLSLGLQVLDDRLLAYLGRGHTAADALGAFRAARHAGFANIGVDLIFGLPGQSLRQWEETLRQVLALEPEHVSTYSLQVEEGTVFGRWAREGRLEAAGRPLPGDDAAADMYLTARELLVSAGYEHYEISNFARPGFRSRHNQIYWRNGEYLGLGPGAHSHLRRRRFRNTGRLDLYREAVQAGRLPVEEEEMLDTAREMSDTLILGLRLLEGVSLADFRRRFGQPLRAVYGAEVAALRDLGLVELAAGRLRLTTRGLPVANEVFCRFV